MTAQRYPDRAVQVVFDLIAKTLEPTDSHVTFTRNNVYVVSFHFVLGSWKALVSTTLPDGMYYEVTYNTVKKETYITSYKQWQHTTVPDEPSS